MTRQQYIYIIERELEKLNRRIDRKILRGQTYMREAQEHKLLLKKIRQHSRRNFMERLFGLLPQF